jgi:hypothetical protein
MVMTVVLPVRCILRGHDASSRQETASSCAHDISLVTIRPYRHPSVKPNLANQNAVESSFVRHPEAILSSESDASFLEYEFHHRLQVRLVMKTPPDPE